MSRFQRATRKQLKLRLALCGPTGSGKTRTSLKVAKYLGKRIAVIDTENRSASKYVGATDVPEFDVLELESYSPKTYVEAIKDAEHEGYDVVVIDGITQAWSGKDGALEQVDKAAKRSQAGNSFTAWRDITPLHNAFVDAMVHCKAHLIVTMRSKTEWVLEENERGKKVPRKVGMAPEQRNGVEFEFDVVGDLDVDHNLLITKTRCDALDGALINKPGRDLAEMLSKWLSEGEAAPARPLAPTSTPSSTASQSGSSRRQETSERRDEKPSSNSSGGQSSASATVDEYGLAVPTCPCPVVRPGKANAGKRWDELPGPLVAKMLDESGHLMTADQAKWADYLVTKRQARKAREAEQAAAEAALAAQEGSAEPAGAEAGCGADPADGQAAQ